MDKMQPKAFDHIIITKLINILPIFYMNPLAFIEAIENFIGLHDTHTRQTRYEAHCISVIYSFIFK